MTAWLLLVGLAGASVLLARKLGKLRRERDELRRELDRADQECVDVALRCLGWRMRAQRAERRLLEDGETWKLGYD